MQDRYTGDIGDYATYALLRALGEGERLGVAWYLYPDENHNADGRHIGYLRQPGLWRALDAPLFDTLAQFVAGGRREVAAVEQSGILATAVFSGERLACAAPRYAERKAWRRAWFERVLGDLGTCSLVFADQDNGLCEDSRFKPGNIAHWKRIPLSETLVLAKGRSAIIYHHNSRVKGGHAQEIQQWLRRLGEDAFALYWRRYSNRTFFVLRPTEAILARAREFVTRWSPHFELHALIRPFRV